MASAAAPALSAPAEAPSVQVRPTRSGYGAAVLAVVMLAAALNTGNNLLYLLAALIVSMVPVSIRVACRSLAAVSVDLLLPSEVTAGDEAEAALRVQASERSVIGLRIHDADGRSVGIPFVEAGGSTVRPFPLRAVRRGPMQVELQLDCLHPWGLMRARRTGPSAELLVLPRPLPGAEAPALLGLATDGRPTERPGQGQDLLEIRNYAPGDDARRIDWKATARRERTMVRQGAREEDRRATVVIDPSLPGDDAAAEDRVEDAISRAAGAVVGLLRSGWQVRLVHPGGDCRGGELEQLRALARLRPPERAMTASWWRARVSPGEPVVHCSAGERGS